MIRLVLCLIAFMVTAGSLTAQNAQVQILPGWRTDSGAHMAGLDIRLAPGWKTYWRRPGEAGIPPSFNWSGSDNVADVTVRWPVPKVFWQSGMRSVGYDGGVVLPLEVTPRRPGQPMTLRLSLEMGVCRDVCIPVQSATAVVLPTQATSPDPRIRAALSNRPFTRSEAAVAEASCAIRLAPDGAVLTATLRMPPLGTSEEIVFEPSDPRLWVSEPVTRRRGDTLVSTARIQPPRGQPLTLDKKGMRITVIGKRGAAEIAGC